MPPEFEFSPDQLLTNLGLFVVVPLWVAAFVVAGIHRVETRARTPNGARTSTGAPRGRLGMWTTGALALVLGFLSCAGWLSWTAADHDGTWRSPGLPAPTSFPSWQVWACGLTTVAACLLAAHLSRTLLSGGLAAAAGTAGGFTAAFCVALAVPENSQGGVGLFLSIVGWGLGLTILMGARAVLLSPRT